MIMRPRAPQPGRSELDISGLLVRGGDERIAVDPGTGLNRYGCGAAPERAVAAFGSATCSVISDSAQASLQAMEERFRRQPRAAFRDIEARRIRDELGRLCGLGPDASVVLAPSGTDLHLIVADLVRGGERRPLVTIMPDPGETGRGVPMALRGLRFGLDTPYGGPCIAGDVVPGAVQGQVVTIPLRLADGAPRAAQTLDADFDAACGRAVRAGGKVLLMLVDCSKTGLVAPSLACAIDLKARFGDAVDVLVDACQLRLSSESLATYVDAGFLVIVTGSKFVSGPPFSGALLLGAALADRLRRVPLSSGLADYCARDDWPEDWSTRRFLPAADNTGLLFRWQAALHELRAFRALPGHRVAAFLNDFGAAVTGCLDDEPAFERLASPPLARGAAGEWDSFATIFPFLLLNPGRAALSVDQTELVFRALRDGRGGSPIHLGQPVSVGARHGRPLSALRLCASARLVVEALTDAGGADRVIQRASDTLARTARQVRLTAG